MIHRSLRALALLALCAVASLAAAQPSWPSRPIAMVVPYPPGALTDSLGRTVAQRLSDALKSPFVTENRPGAGTLVAADYVAKAPADGHVLLMATSTTMGISPVLYKDSPAAPLRDLVPVAQIGYVNFFLITNKDFGAKDFPQFVDLVRRNPGKFNYASVGNGSPHHLFMEVLKKQYGLAIEHVPYKGTAAALPDVLSGKIQVMFADATVAVPNIQAGKVGVLGTSAATPNSLIPSVRPLAESVPGFDWTAWQGIAAPVNTPREIVERVNSEVRKMLETREFREQLVRFGMEPAPLQTVAEFGEYVRADAARWAVAVRDSGAKSD